MANGSFIAVTPGSGAKLATGATYTENANVVQDEKVILGENYLASYTAISGAASFAAANSHMVQVMAGASLKVRIRRIELFQQAAVTTGGLMRIDLLRLTSAGTGGTVITPAPLDTSDAASGATVMKTPTAKGTTGVTVALVDLYLQQTYGASTPQTQPIYVWDFDRPRSKPLIIPAGTANGIAVNNETSLAAGALDIVVYFDETPW